MIRTGNRDMKNKIMLITYSDSFGKNLKELKQMVDTYFKREINGIHILPFFPSSGDRGFAPINYREVDPQFGTWEDIQALAEDYELMFDFMINHLSRRSPEFLDFLEKHDQSEYADMFLRFKKFWPNGEPDQKQVDMLNKRKPCAPCEDILFADGMTEKIWCTFDNEQMDLNLESETAWRFVEKTLRFLMDQGAAMIRLDAFAFATKKLNTSCFFIEPEMWDMMKRVQGILDEKTYRCFLKSMIIIRYSRKLRIMVIRFMTLSFPLWCCIPCSAKAAGGCGIGLKSAPEISIPPWIPMMAWEPWMWRICFPKRSFRQ